MDSLKRSQRGVPRGVHPRSLDTTGAYPNGVGDRPSAGTNSPDTDGYRVTGRRDTGSTNVTTVRNGGDGVKSVREDAFVDAVYRARTQIGAGMWLVLVTTDADPMRLRESIKLATQGGTEVLVLIVPTVLFQRAHLETITEAYDAYTEFEQLRRELDSHPRVTALEVAPGDRLRTLLSVEQSERHKPEAR